MIVLEPVAEPRPVPVPLAPRVDTLIGQRIGFVDNSKPNVSLLFDMIEQRLKEQFALGGILRLKKPSASMPLDKAMLDRVLQECDVAIVAMGD